MTLREGLWGRPAVWPAGSAGPVCGVVAVRVALRDCPVFVVSHVFSLAASCFGAPSLDGLGLRGRGSRWECVSTLNLFFQLPSAAPGRGPRAPSFPSPRCRRRECGAATVARPRRPVLAPAARADEHAL